MATASQVRARSRSRSDTGRDHPALLDDLLTMAGSLANSRKEYAAAQLESLADSVRQFGEARPAIHTVKSYASTAADTLDELADYVVESELADIMADAREFTRRHPVITFGGTVAAGIIITQIVQSRAESMRSAARPRRSRSSAASRRRAAQTEVQASAEEDQGGFE